jgi:hypothetical protein
MVWRKAHSLNDFATSLALHLPFSYFHIVSLVAFAVVAALQLEHK